MRREGYLLPALLYMALIFWLSSRPAPETVQRWPILGPIKLVHLVEYGILALLWYGGLARYRDWGPRKTALIAILLTFAWGISDEIHQAFVPSRTGTAMDAFTDLLAACTAMALATFVRALKNKLCYKASRMTNEEHYD